jgi:predicted nucleic acid-binding protein
MTPPIIVLDASVGVKWFRPNEAGTRCARELYMQALRCEVRLGAPVHFVHEVLSVVKREMGSRAIMEAWNHIQATGIAIVPLTDEVVAEAAAQCETLDCSFYDALAPACASMLHATLATADERAHGAYPDVLIVRD